MSPNPESTPLFHHTPSEAGCDLAESQLLIASSELTNPRMHLFHISVLNGELRDMEQVHSGICELGQLRRIDKFPGEWWPTEKVTSLY